MVENADCRYSVRKLILVELFRTDQLTRPTGRERTGSRIKAGEWQEPTKLGTLRLWLSLALSKLGVVAFSSTGDPEMGDYDDEPTVFFRNGRLPPAFD